MRERVVAWRDRVGVADLAVLGVNARHPTAGVVEDLPATASMTRARGYAWLGCCPTKDMDSRHAATPCESRGGPLSAECGGAASKIMLTRSRVGLPTAMHASPDRWSAAPILASGCPGNEHPCNCTHDHDNGCGNEWPGAPFVNTRQGLSGAMTHTPRAAPI